MFMTQEALSRRTVLRGMGATVALPLLDAMVPAGTAWAKTAAAPARPGWSASRWCTARPAHRVRRAKNNLWSPAAAGAPSI